MTLAKGTPSIIKGEDHFSTVLHEGTGTGQKVGKFVPFTNNATISKAVRFNYADTPKLVSSALGTPTSDKKFTFSTWFKLGQLTQQYQGIFSTSTDNSGSGGNVTRYSPLCVFNKNSQEGAIFGYDYSGSTYYWRYDVNVSFDLEDVSTWHHFQIILDTTQSTDSDRMKIYIDGTQLDASTFAQLGYPSLNQELATTKSGYYHDIGLGYNARFEGCLAEMNLLDGQALSIDTFGMTDTSTGRWIPKSFSGLSYGNNGFRAQFANTAGQTLGYVTGGGTANNFFTATNMDSTDCITDTPTSNHMVFDQQITTGSGSTIKQAGTEVNFVSGSGYPTVATSMLIPNSGKWYWEIKLTTSGGYQGLANSPCGVIDINHLWGGSAATGSPFTNQYGGMGGLVESGFKFYSIYNTTHDFSIGSSSMASGDWMVIALDMDDGKGYWGWYDTSAGGSITWFANDGGTDGNPSTGANPTVTFDPRAHNFQVAQSGYAPGSYPGTFAYNFGSRPFNFTAPTGFIGLSQDQFPETVGKSHFGRSGDTNFIPDLVWTKNRDQTDSHGFYDTTRGIKNRMQTDSTSQEAVVHDGLQKFLKGGYQTLQNHENNAIDESYVNWMWKAGGGTTSANTDGSGATLASTIQANQDAGFSIVEVTAPGSPSGTYKIAHGLGAVPHWIIGKNRENSGGYNWSVFHHKSSSVPQNEFLELNTSDAYADNDTVWGDTAPTSSVFTVGTGVPLLANEKTIFYCWTGIPGFSKFGGYIGNNSTNGPFVNTGFKPALVIIKSTSGHTGYPWAMYDNARSPTNPVHPMLEANRNVAEVTSDEIDFLSNGFKLRQSYSYSNAAVYYLYMAFAQHPFLGDGTNPATAR